MTIVTIAVNVVAIVVMIAISQPQMAPHATTTTTTTTTTAVENTLRRMAAAPPPTAVTAVIVVILPERGVALPLPSSRSLCATGPLLPSAVRSPSRSAAPSSSSFSTAAAIADA